MLNAKIQHVLDLFQLSINPSQLSYTYRKVTLDISESPIGCQWGS